MFFKYLFENFSRGFITKVNYQKLIIEIILFIIFLVAIMTVWLGMIILMVSTGVGIISAITKITRTHGMGCLLLPVILYCKKSKLYKLENLNLFCA
ncbi:hypothetical protein HN415_00050 [Candidatus Woesearchaeota archaeon]|nr:hypothetical protein [Candidatus Woesearchaeota archaeon]